MEIFGGGTLEHKVMEKSGCLNYTTTSWETVNPNLHERRVSYKFNRQVSIFGEEVTCTQQKSPLPNNGWTINEALTLHNIPFGDFYYVRDRILSMILLCLPPLLLQHNRALELTSVEKFPYNSCVTFKQAFLCSFPVFWQKTNRHVFLNNRYRT